MTSWHVPESEIPKLHISLGYWVESARMLGGNSQQNRRCWVEMVYKPHTFVGWNYWPHFIEFSPNTKGWKTFGILWGVWERSEHNMRQAFNWDIKQLSVNFWTLSVINVWNFNGISGALVMLGSPRCDKLQLAAQLSRHNVLSSLASELSA